MRNIHVLNQNIYITTDEEIKPNTYCLINGVLCKTEIIEGEIVSRQLNGGATMDICKSEYLEIILTTDQDLIKDGVQAIDDEFLEWFVKNPSREYVNFISYGNEKGTKDYELTIPKQVPKQETMYSYDEVRQIAYNAYCLGQLEEPTENKYNGWIQQFKK